MSAHRYHPTGKDPDGAILFDDCASCESKSKDLGLELDGDRWSQMWARMLAAEFHVGDDRYRTLAEARLGRQMYYMAIALQRYADLDPRTLISERGTR